MVDEILNSLLKEYSQKKLQAELDLEKRKEELYNSIPRLRQIEDDLNNFAISTAKNILKNGSSPEEEQELKNKVELLKAEKARILAELNLPDNYLQPFYSCPICKDTGYVSDGGYNMVMCSCLKQKLLDYSFNKSNMSNLNKENFSTFNPNMFSDEVDIAKFHFNISPRTNILNIKNKCVQFVENFEDPAQKNLLFTGNTGLR
jgi:istB domain protein ATP-binding protein